MSGECRASTPTKLGLPRGRRGFVSLATWRAIGSVSAVASASRASRDSTGRCRHGAPRSDRDSAGHDRLRPLVRAAARPRHARDQPRYRAQRLERRAATPQPPRGGPRRRQQPRHARAQPQSRWHPERGDRRRPRALGALAQCADPLRRRRRARVRRYRRARQLGRLPLLAQQRRRAVRPGRCATDAQVSGLAGGCAAPARCESDGQARRPPGRDGRPPARRAVSPVRCDQRCTRVDASAQPTRHPVSRCDSRTRVERRRQADGDRARRGSRPARARPSAHRGRRLGDRRGSAPRRQRRGRRREHPCRGHRGCPRAWSRARPA